MRTERWALLIGKVQRRIKELRSLTEEEGDDTSVTSASAASRRGLGHFVSNVEFRMEPRVALYSGEYSLDWIGGQDRVRLQFREEDDIHYTLSSGRRSLCGRGGLDEVQRQIDVLGLWRLLRGT